MNKKFKRYLYLYKRFISQDLKRIVEYQLDFIIQFIASFLMQITGLITIWGIFNNVRDINGWGYWDIVLIFSLMNFAKGFGEIFFEGPWSMNGLIIRGGMDYMLVKPIPVIFQIFASRIGLNGIGNIITAVILLTTALIHLSVSISWLKILVFFILFFIALPIKGAIILASNCITFWTKAQGNAFGNLIHNVGEYTKYPITIYPKVIQFVLAFIIPYAFVSFFPASMLLNKGVGAKIMWLVPIISVCSIFSSILIFNKGLKLYESVGN